MKTDERAEQEGESPEHPGLMQRLGHAVTERELRMIDRTIGLFERWRQRIEPHEAEDDRHRDRHPALAEPVSAATGITPAHHRLRGFLIIVALVLAAGVAGMTFSYSLLRKSLNSEELIIDDLRDQVAQLEKADARNVSIQAKDQRLIAEQKKTIREYEAKVADDEEQMAKLRQQIVALTPTRREPTVTAAGRRAPSGQRAVFPQKTGNCVATGSNAAADLARCVENFNRP